MASPRDIFSPISSETPDERRVQNAVLLGLLIVAIEL